MKKVTILLIGFFACIVLQAQSIYFIHLTGYTQATILSRDKFSPWTDWKDISRDIMWDVKGKSLAFVNVEEKDIAFWNIQKVLSHKSGKDPVDNEPWKNIMWGAQDKNGRHCQFTMTVYKFSHTVQIQIEYFNKVMLYEGLFVREIDNAGKENLNIDTSTYNTILQ
jgi:hypothetical protein